MGIFDMFKRHKDNAGGTGTALKDRMTGMAAGHSDKVNQGIDKVGQTIDEKTGNKYSGQVNTGVGKAKDMFGRQTGQGTGAPNQPADMPIPDAGTQGGDAAQPPQS